MSRKQMLPLIIVVMLVMLFLIGCGGQLQLSKEPSTQESIIGVWQDPNNTSVSIQFKGDGTVEFLSDNGPTTKGTYKIVESLVFELPDSQRQSIPIVSISENEIALDSPGNGNVTTLRRVGAPTAPAKAPQEPVGPPQEVQDAAIKQEKSLGMFLQKDHKVTCANKLDLTNADQANGISEKWCVKVEYLETSSLSSENATWYDGEYGWMMVKKNGEWSSRGGCLCK